MKRLTGWAHKQETKFATVPKTSNTMQSLHIKLLWLVKVFKPQAEGLQAAAR